MDTCWFCGTRPAEIHSSAIVKAGKQIGESWGTRKHTKSLIETTRVSVPRCAKCETYHRRVRRGGGFLGGLGCLAPVIISFVIIESTSLGLFLNILIPVVGAIVGMGIAVLAVVVMARSAFGTTGEFTKNEGYKLEFPAVEELKQEGWNVW